MNIQEILRQNNVDFKLSGEHRNVRSGWTGVDCSCSPGSGNYYAAFSPNGHGYSCWRCGKVPVGTALMRLTGQPWRIVKTWLDGLDRGEPHETTPRGKLVVPKGTGDLLPAHRHYLEGRGMDPDRLVALWGLKGIGIASRLAWRVWIPISLEGRTVSWTTRTIGDTEPRYWAAEPHEEEVNNRHLLFGSDYIRHAAIITEGPFDAMKVGPGAVATMGMGHNSEQVLAISKIAVRAVVFDSEPEAQRRARQLCEQLQTLPGKTYRVELDAKDPGSADDNEIALLRRSFLD